MKPHGYELTSVRTGNLLDVVRVSERKTLLRRETQIERKTIGRIGYRNEGETVAIKTLKELRRMCRLTEEDGVDRDAFYDGTDVIDVFVNRYRTVLRRLAST